MRKVIEHTESVYQALMQSQLVAFQRVVTCISMSQGDWTILVETNPNLGTTTAALAGTNEREITMYKRC